MPHPPRAPEAGLASPRTDAGAIRRVNHIAVVVKDIERALVPYVEGLGLRPTTVEYVPGFDVKVVFLPVGDTQIELVQPMGAEGDLVDFLKVNGDAGLHHIAFETSDVRATLDRMSSAGVPMKDRVPRSGAHGSTVAFAERRGFDGVVVEMVEPAQGTPGEHP